MSDIPRRIFEASPVELRMSEVTHHVQTVAEEIFSGHTTRRGRTFDEIYKKCKGVLLEHALVKGLDWTLNPMQPVKGDPTTYAWDVVTDTGETVDCKLHSGMGRHFRFSWENLKTFMKDAERGLVDYIVTGRLSTLGGFYYVDFVMVAKAPSFHRYIQSAPPQGRDPRGSMYDHVRAIQDGEAWHAGH